MLVLTRRVGDTIRIGDDIEVTLLQIKQGVLGQTSLRIGITAPLHVSVWREEIVQENGGTPPAPRKP